MQQDPDADEDRAQPKSQRIAPLGEGKRPMIHRCAIRKVGEALAFINFSLQCPSVDAKVA
jgi:hypothetical protein